MKKADLKRRETVELVVFDLVQGSDGIPPKPDPAVLSRVLRRLRKEPCRSWMVGDTVYDVRAGKSAG